MIIQQDQTVSVCLFILLFMLEVRLKIILPLCHQLYIRQSEIIVQHSVPQFALRITAFSILGQYTDWIGFLFTFYFLSGGEWLQSLVVKILKQASEVKREGEKCYITKQSFSFFFPLPKMEPTKTKTNKPTKKQILALFTGLLFLSQVTFLHSAWKKTKKTWNKKSRNEDQITENETEKERKREKEEKEVQKGKRRSKRRRKRKIQEKERRQRVR